MEFEWDEDKRLVAIAKHSVDLLDAALIFEGPVITRADQRRDYGEPRFISIGMVGGYCYVVVHTPRNGNMRLISAWLGGRREREEYQASVPLGTPPDEG